MTAASDWSPGEPRLTFGVQEVADALGVSRELVKHMIRTGQLPSVSTAAVGSSAVRPSNASWPAETPHDDRDH
jgi:hypothetical protein